jgi:hypothetical protein
MLMLMLLMLDMLPDVVTRMSLEPLGKRDEVGSTVCH